MRIPIDADGHSDADLPKYAILLERDDGPLDAILRAIKSKTRHEIVTCRSAGTSDGQAQFELQLGERCETGGWDGTGRITITI